MKIEGQAALVTGGASGLGEATARELARLGAKIAVLDRNAELAAKVAADIEKEFGDGCAVACGCDITDTASGIGSAKRIVGKDGNAAPLEDFVRVVNINLIGGYNMARLFAAACAKPLPMELPEPVQRSLAASIPFPPRLGKPAEFAELACHIVTNGHLNGEAIRLDGALRMAPR